MRPLHAVLVGLAVFALMLSSTGGRADISDPGLPSYVNGILTDFVTPTVAPGKALTFSLKVNNPYNESVVMTEMVLTVGIYKYATKDEAMEVNDSFPHPPLINGDSTEYARPVPSLLKGANTSISFDIETSRKTPHGTYYSQSTYLLRFMLSFEFQGNATPIVLKSRGFFTDDEWNRMVTYEGGRNVFNHSYMHSLGVDGIVPDSSFGLKDRIPTWPLVLLGIACVATAALAVSYFVLDNPGKFPALEKRLYYLRGKLSEFGRHLKDRRRK